MTKSEAAFLLSCDRLAKQGRLYFWTFTFAEVLDLVDTRKRWNHLLTLLRRRWPEACGLRIFELHKEHGLHVHLLSFQTLAPVGGFREMLGLDQGGEYPS
ncbi:MAG: hypothetical protein V4584_12555 [Verrucomicrobiota bacterium]